MERKLNFLPGLVLAPIEKINKLIPGWEIHSIQDVTSFVPYDKEFELEKCKPLEFTRKRKTMEKTY